MTGSAIAKLRERVDQLPPMPAPDDVRWCALARLYARRTAVDDLIDALEKYEQE